VQGRQLDLYRYCHLIRSCVCFAASNDMNRAEGEVALAEGESQAMTATAESPALAAAVDARPPKRHAVLSFCLACRDMMTLYKQCLSVCFTLAVIVIVLLVYRDTMRELALGLRNETTRDEATIAMANATENLFRTLRNLISFSKTTNSSGMATKLMTALLTNDR